MDKQNEEFTEIVYKGISVPYRFYNSCYHLKGFKETFSTLTRAMEFYANKLEKDKKKEFAKIDRQLKKMPLSYNRSKLLNKLKKDEEEWQKGDQKNPQ